LFGWCATRSEDRRKAHGEEEEFGFLTKKRRSLPNGLEGKKITEQFRREGRPGGKRGRQDESTTSNLTKRGPMCAKKGKTYRSAEINFTRR